MAGHLPLLHLSLAQQEAMHCCQQHAVGGGGGAIAAAVAVGVAVKGCAAVAAWVVRRDLHAAKCSRNPF